jgi:hypothetical protein
MPLKRFQQHDAPVQAWGVMRVMLERKEMM